MPRMSSGSPPPPPPWSRREVRTPATAGDTSASAATTANSSATSKSTSHHRSRGGARVAIPPNRQPGHGTRGRSQGAGEGEAEEGRGRLDARPRCVVVRPPVKWTKGEVLPSRRPPAGEIETKERPQGRKTSTNKWSTLRGTRQPPLSGGGPTTHQLGGKRGEGGKSAGPRLCAWTKRSEARTADCAGALLYRDGLPQ